MVKVLTNKAQRKSVSLLCLLYQRRQLGAIQQALKTQNSKLKTQKLMLQLFVQKKVLVPLVY